jgi:glycosyltransferase involved in cell wall biosynthesis
MEMHRGREGSPPGRICLQWPSIGPYHLARLRALAAANEAAPVVGLATSSREQKYAWERGDQPCRIETVFDRQDFESIDPGRIRREVMKRLTEIGPDVVGVNSYSLPDARASVEWCRRNGKMAILCTDSKRDDAPRVAWRELLKKQLVSLFDAAVVAGSPQRRYLVDLGFPAARIRDGLDVVDNEFFRRVTEPAFGDAKSRYFLSCGRLIPLKNFDALLRGYVRYRSESPEPWRLIIAGDGPERERLTNLASELGGDGIEFVGHQSYEDLRKYYHGAGAFVLPTINERWGLVVNEAMASGLPVIVSERAGCAQDLVQHGENGFLVDPTDSNDLADRLRDMASDGDRRKHMGHRSLQIIADWGLERFASGFMDCVADGIRPQNLRYGARFRALLPRCVTALSSRVDSFHSVET